MINDRYQRRIGANLARNQEVAAAAAARDVQLQGAEARLVARANVRVDPAVEGGPGGGVPVVGADGAVGELHPEPEDAPDAAPPVQAVAAGVDNVNWNTFSDTVSVYSVGVNTWANEDEVVPYSSLYNHVAERITDPNATGALGALVKGTTMKDSASVITMVKHMQRGNGSYRDEAPLVRAYNMLTSTAAHGSPPDPVVYKWMRNFVPAGDIQLESFQGQPVGGSVIAVPHDMFAEYAFLNFNTPFPGIAGQGNHFSMDSMDETWVAIPVSNDLIRTKALIPYMLSFLTSGYTNGTANHIIPGQFNSPQHEGQRMQMGSYRLFPRSNLAYIPGAIHAVLVLTDCTTAAAPDAITGLGYQIPVASVFRHEQPGQPLPVPTPVDNLVAIWWALFQVAAGGSDLVTAINEIESKLAIDGVVKRASSVATELHGAQYPPIMIPAENTHYQMDIPLHRSIRKFTIIN
ncbi:Uncharacterized protein OBRU01_10435 [Operophtera brumata]|uniref:Uncharacterized protein n=1 Tax=Operophtera brumata TaxID=104452 RepID=A0A0L7LE02_OPEBR|nr:Uncharacterized protein OBRU01_10435 [Operophtera brumata]